MTKQIFQEHAGAIQVNKEVFTTRDEETEIGLSTLKSQTVVEKDSMEAGSTSGMKLDT
jgi:hypothetical protein